MSIEALKQEFDIVTRYIHFPLHPDTPSEGLSIQAMFKNRSPDDLKAMGDRFRDLMQDAGLPYNSRTMTYNSRLAQELGAWADEETNAGEQWHNRLFQAYFAESANIGDPAALLDIVRELDLPLERAEEVLANRLYSTTVNADWQRAWENGITGVPTYTAKDLFVVGYQPPDVLARFVKHLKTLA